MIKENIKIWDSSERMEHRHSEIELIYVIEGEIDFWCSGQYRKMKRGEFGVVNSEELHNICCREKAIYCEIQIDYGWLCTMTGSRRIIFIREPQKPDKLAIPILINQLLKWYVNQKASSVLLGYGIFYRLLDVLIQNYMVKTEDWENERSNRAQQITVFIYAHYMESVTLNELAESMHLSNAYLSRYIKQQFGMSFVEYLNKVRMEHAAEDLKNTDDTVTKIALGCGFSTPSAFNRKFKEMFHQTPRAYRKENAEVQKEKFPVHDNKIHEQLRAYYETHEIQNDTSYPVKEENVIVKMNETTAARKKIRCLINIGAAKDLLRSDVQQHVIWLNRKIGIEYLRFWSPFSSEMINVEEDECDFEKLDKVLDFLEGEGIRPFIDLGNKPRRIQRTANESVVFESEDNIRSIEVWELVLTRWMEHLEERYGAEYVEQWYFELWRSERKEVERGEYLDDFAVLYRCVKNVFPKAMVGGCGFKPADAQILAEDIEEIMGGAIHPDFISAYFYAYELHEDGNENYMKRSADQDLIWKRYCMLKEVLRKKNLENIPIYATEWNLTVSDRNIVNDSCARAAYLLHNQIRWAEEEVPLGYFYGSDCLSEYRDVKKLIFGAAGLITKNGIFKPAAYAVQFMKKAYKYIVRRGERYLVTADKKGNYAIVCENYKYFGYFYFLKEENEIVEDDKMFDNMEMLDLRFQLEEMPDGVYEIKRHVVNPLHGSIYDEWKRYGFTERIEYDDIEYFRHICVPQISVEKRETENKSMELKMRLAPHEIDFIHIRRMSTRLS